MHQDPVVIPPQARAGAPTTAGGDIYATLVTGAETSGGSYSVHAIVPPGGGPPAHIYTREDGAFYLISGELTFLVGEGEIVVGGGTFLHVPRGTEHRFRNASDADAETIFQFAPAGIEGRFRELEERPEAIVEIGRNYGGGYCFDEQRSPRRVPGAAIPPPGEERHDG